MHWDMHYAVSIGSGFGEVLVSGLVKTREKQSGLS